MEADPLKSKSRGTVYERKADGITISSLAGFTHDMDSRGIASGAPVIDERTGVIIGIHTLSQQAAASSGRKPAPRNTMITMNEWLERTLRTEMESEPTGESTRL
jgi:V8-like Glu-specific endopeptidase